MAVCFAFQNFRLNPNFSLWVFISHALIICFLVERLQNRNPETSLLSVIIYYHDVFLKLWFMFSFQGLGEVIPLQSWAWSKVGLIYKALCIKPIVRTLKTLLPLPVGFPGLILTLAPSSAYAILLCAQKPSSSALCCLLLCFQQFNLSFPPLK